MIPNSPILLLSPFKSHLAGAQYNPFTLFLKETRRGAYMVRPDLQFNDLKIEDELQKMIEDEASMFHEEFHWLQYSGTTVGVFLALRRYSQERTVVNALNRIDKKYLIELINQRLLKEPIPIVPINEEGELDVSVIGINNPLDPFHQIWYDHQLIYSIFNDSRSQDNIEYPRGQVFGEIADDLILHLSDTCGLKYEGPQVTRKWFQFESNEIIFVKLGNRRLTTLSIIEGITASNELQLLLFRKAADEYITKFIENLDSSNYGTALSAFLTVLQPKIADFDDLVNMLPTFNVICDIALNPPLPPFFMSAPESGTHWHWSDIYPPLRFKKLVEAIQEIGLLPQNASHETLSKYIDEICVHLNWLSPNSYVHPFKKCNHVLDFEVINLELSDIKNGEEKQERDFELNELLGFDYFHYLFWVQFKVWEKRKSNLPMFINPIECRCKSEMFHYYEDLALAGMFGSVWVKPPFIWRLDDTWGFTTKFPNFNSWLLTNSCFHYFLYDLMAGTGAFDLSLYPPQIKQHPVLDSVRKSMEASFGIKIPNEVLSREYPQHPLFALGKIVGTPKSLEAFSRNNVDPSEYILKHVTGDWGITAGNYYDIDLSDIERQRGLDVIDDIGKINKWALENREAITSMYILPDKTEVWITTETGWEYTVIYLSEER